MGGQILDYEAKTIWNQGMEIGKREGKQEGKQEGEQKKAKEAAQNFYAMGMEIETIAKGINYPIETVKQWLYLD